MEQKKETESHNIHNALNQVAKAIHSIISSNSNDKSSLPELEKDFRGLFDKLYIQSEKDNYFWQFCPFSVYEEHFHKRYNKYRTTFIDCTLLDFGNLERANLEEDYINDRGQSSFRIFFNMFWIDSEERDDSIHVNFLFTETEKKLEYTYKRKMEFLKSVISIEQNEIVGDEGTFMDYSENNKAQRIVFLHELGILDFLKDKMTREIKGFSVNKLAEIVSTFSQIDQKTGQSYLNPIYSKKTDQRKNPLTQSNLELVRKKMKDIGF